MADVAEQQDDDEWAPTPPERRMRARLVSGEMVEYKDLKVGDVFQAISVDGRAVHPFETVIFGPDGAVMDPETNDEVYAAVTAAPVRGFAGCEGWAVQVEVGPRAELMRRFAH